MAVFENCNLIFPKQPPAISLKPDISMRHKHFNKFSLWGSHDPAIYRDPISGNYYTYCTGAVARRSSELIVWENIGKIVESPPKESVEWVGDKGIWAPDIVKEGLEYRLYCSNSTWGSRRSCIFLAVADHPEGPFIPREIVLKTNDDSLVNAIDANIIVDQQGTHFMAYGSFWGGCYLVQLDKRTGLLKEQGIGKCIARRPPWFDCAIEGPYIIFNPETKYYYLFVSYGSLKNDYNIRVGRSRTVAGPYCDHNGRKLTDLEDHNNDIGYMVACGYRFEQGIGYMAPGHNSVLHDADGQWYLVCHIREHDYKQPQIATMHIYKMFWTNDGWPVISPQVYAGEQNQVIEPEWISGTYERIKMVPAIPQGVHTSVPMVLKTDGSFRSCSVKGSWQYPDENTIIIQYGNIIETLIVSAAWDWQKHEPTIILTGKDQYGIGVWGKKV